MQLVALAFVAPIVMAQDPVNAVPRVRPGEWASMRYAEVYADPTFSYLEEFCRFNMQMNPQWKDCNTIHPGDRVHQPAFWVLLRMRHGSLPPEVENDVVLGSFPPPYREPIVQVATALSTQTGEPFDDRTVAWSAWFVKHMSCEGNPRLAGCIPLSSFSSFASSLSTSDFQYLRENLVDILPRDYALVMPDGSMVDHVHAFPAP